MPTVDRELYASGGMTGKAAPRGFRLPPPLRSARDKGRSVEEVVQIFEKQAEAGRVRRGASPR